MSVSTQHQNVNELLDSYMYSQLIPPNYVSTSSSSSHVNNKSRGIRTHDCSSPLFSYPILLSNNVAFSFSQKRHFLTQSLFIKKVFSSEIVFFVEEERNFRPELLVTAFVKILSLCDVIDAFLINRDCFVYTSLEKVWPLIGNL